MRRGEKPSPRDAEREAFEGETAPRGRRRGEARLGGRDRALGAVGLSGSCQFLAKIRQDVARFRLYRHRFLQLNMRFAAFFKVYQILKLKFLKFGNILQILRHLQNFC